MSFEIGTITSGTPGTALRNRVESLLTAEGWPFVDEVMYEGMRYRVWRRNHATYPFHVILVVNDGDGDASAFQIGLCEGYNTSTSSAIRPAPPDCDIDPSSDGSYGGGTEYHVATSGKILYTYYESLPTTGFTYFISVKNDRLLVVANVADSIYVAAEACQYQNPILPGDPYPIVVFSFVGSYRIGAFTRQLGAHFCDSYGAGSWNAYPRGSMHVEWGYPYEQLSYPDGKFGVVPVLIVGQQKESTSSGGTNITDAGRGYPPGAVYVPDGVTGGDRLLVNGVEKYYAIPNWGFLEE